MLTTRTRMSSLTSSPQKLLTAYFGPPSPIMFSRSLRGVPRRGDRRGMHLATTNQSMVLHKRCGLGLSRVDAIGLDIRQRAQLIRSQETRSLLQDSLLSLLHFLHVLVEIRLRTEIRVIPIA